MLIHFFKGGITHITPMNLNTYIKKGLNLDCGYQLFFISNQKNTLSEKDIDMYKMLFDGNDVRNKYQFWSSPKIILKQIVKLKADDKLIFHSMINPFWLRLLIYIILFCKSKLKDCVLVCWNLSDATIISNVFIIKLYNKIHYFFLRKMRKVCLITLEDKTIFDSDSKALNSILLPLMRDENPVAVKHNKYKDDGVLKIMVSHSGWEHNNHFHSFNLLRKFKDENIQIFCPLCYGDTKYIEKVIETGKTIFGDKFRYIRELMPYDKYVDYLNSNIAVYITSADIQTGLGAANILLRSGARLFLGENLLRFYKELGVTVDSYEAINNFSYSQLCEPISDTVYNKNIENITKFYDCETIFNEYKKILNR